MKVIKLNNEYLIKIHTDADKDLGIFLIFLGLVGAVPFQYIIFSALGFKIHNFILGIYAGILFIILGFFLILFSKKKIFIYPDKITLKDGLFKKSISYYLKEKEITIKLKNYEIEYRSMPLEFWQVYLTCGKHEYLIDKKPNNQLEIRNLAEALAKIISAPFIDTTFESGDLIINPEDLDLYFKERAKKYPQLIGHPTEKPAKIFMSIKEEKQTKIFSWGISSSRFLFEILFASIIILILSFIPLHPNALTLYQSCQKNHNFLFYYIFSFIIIIILITISGYKINLKINKDSINLQEFLWKLLLKQKTVPALEVEEINLYHGMRGYILQIISDKNIINLRLYNKENAAFLAWEIKKELIK